MSRKSKFEKLVGRPAVVDANVVIDLKEMDILFLLNEIFSMVIIPLDTIERELDPEIRECLAGIEYNKGIIRSETGYNVYSQCLKKKSLSHYDRMSIALSMENSCILCINEKPGRSQAEELGIEITGTLGILAAAYRSGVVNKKQAINLFGFLQENGSCYISPALLDEVLSELGISIKG